MRQIVPDDALLYWIEKVVEEDIVYHLFVNNFTPDRDTVLADFTERSAFHVIGENPPPSGYGPITVAAADFTFGEVLTHRGTILAAPIDFVGTVADPQAIYGYYATNVAGDRLVACARFDDAPVPWIADVVCTVWPVLGCTSRFAS